MDTATIQQRQLDFKALPASIRNRVKKRSGWRVEVERDKAKVQKNIRSDGYRLIRAIFAVFLALDRGGLIARFNAKTNSVVSR